MTDYDSPDVSNDTHGEFIKRIKADRMQRFTGAFIDQLIFFFLYYFFMNMLGVLVQAEEGQDIAYIDLLLPNLLALAVFASFNLPFLAKAGQTIGKRIVGTQALAPDGRVLGLQEILIKRYLPFTAAGFIPYFGIFVAMIDALFIFRKDLRCMHDLVADTVVYRVDNVRKINNV